MDTYHDLLCTPSPAGLAFECEQGCGRLLVVDRGTGRMTVLGRGEAQVELGLRCSRIVRRRLLERL